MASVGRAALSRTVGIAHACQVNWWAVFRPALHLPTRPPAARPPGRPPARPPTYAAGFGDRSHDVTTTALIKALGEHIGKPLQLRVARPGDAVDTLTVVALEASDGHH